MSEPTSPATPVAPEAAPSTPAPSAPDTRRPRDRVGAIAGELKARLAKQKAAEAAELDDAPAPAPKAPAAPATAKAEAVAAKIEAAGGEAPDQERGESDKQYELRLSKTLGELKAAKAEAAKNRSEADLSKAELGKLKKLLESGKANPLTILEHLGYSYADLTKGIVDDKFKNPEKRLELPPELQAKIDRLEKRDQEIEAERVRAQAEATRAKEVKQIEDFLAANDDDFPFCASMKWAAGNALAEAYSKGETNVTRALTELEETLEANFGRMMGSDKSIAKLLKKDPTVGPRLVKQLEALGMTRAEAKAVVAEATPGSIDEISADPPARSGKPSKADRIAAAAAELRAKRLAEQDDED